MGTKHRLQEFPLQYLRTMKTQLGKPKFNFLKTFKVLLYVITTYVYVTSNATFNLRQLHHTLKFLSGAEYVTELTLGIKRKKKKKIIGS